MNHRRVRTAWCRRVGETGDRGVAGRLEAIGWGLFLIWVGAVLLAGIGWGPALLGIGLIALGGQTARWLFRIELEGFWLLVGAGFVIGGLWQLADVTVPLLPVLVVLAGVTLVVTALRSHRPGQAP